MRYQLRSIRLPFLAFAFVRVIFAGVLFAQQSPDTPQPPDDQSPYQVEETPEPQQPPSVQQPTSDQQLPQYTIEDEKPPAAHYPSERRQSDELAPRALESLRESASSKTEFTLDHSMLVFASKLDSENEDLRRVIAGVSGVSIHRFHFPGPGMYDAAALKSMRHDYQAAGWKQMVNNRPKDGGPGGTGLWIRFENNAISDVAILLAKPDSVNFIVISGSISPLDLVHLGGHFGIPKIQGGVTVPNNKPRS